MKRLAVALLVLASCSSGGQPVSHPVSPGAELALAALASLTTTSAPPVPPAPARASRSRSAGTSRPLPAAPGPADDVFWRLALCESGGNTRAVGGHGRFFGAFQQTPGSWARYGNGGPILEQPYAEQLAAAQRQQRAEGWRPWPVCGRRATGGGGSW